MAFKLVAFACLVAVSSAAIAVAPVSYSSPLVHAPLPVEEYDPHPQYSYAYDVQDGLTGDSKSAQESRDGDLVQGSYSVVDPDGFKRIVDYVAHPQDGFNAVVRRVPLAQVANVARVVAPVSYARPVLQRTPISYSSPIYHI